MRWFAVLLLVIACPAIAQAPDSTLDVVDVQPVLIGGLEALQRGIVYPEADRRAGTQGRVIVRFIVDPAGVPAHVEVVRGVSPGLDSVSVAAVERARFTPGTQDGRPVSVRFTLPVSFRITEESATTLSTYPVPGERWDPPSFVVADSGAVVDGRGRLVFAAPTEGVERVVITVEDGRVLENETTFAPGSALLARIEESATRFASAATLRARADEFYHAVDIVALGVPSAVDLSFDLAARTYRIRAARCETSSPAAGCVSMFPMLIGGFGGVVDRARFPAAVQRPFPDGRVVYATTIDAEGRVASAELVSTTYGNDPVGRGMVDALRESILESRFVVDPNRVEAGPVRVSLPLTFRTDG